MLKGTPIWFKIFFLGILCIIVVSVVEYAKTEYQDHQDGCTPTGRQHMVNSVVNAPNGAFSGLVVEDEFVCKNGRITWKPQYK